MSLDSFSALMHHEEPAVAPLLLELAETIGRASGDGPSERSASWARLVEWLEHRAAALVDVAALPAGLQLAMLHDLVAARLKVEAPWGLDPRLRGVRPECVVETGTGHPVVVAALTAAAAEQAGVPIGFLRDGHALLLVLELQPEAGAIEFGTGRLVSAEALGRRTGLQWSCAHELAALLLDLVGNRAEGLGLRPVEVEARTLATCLPLGPQERRRREVQVARARAAWN